MRRLPFILALLFCPNLWAAIVSVNSGQSLSTIQGIVNAAGTNDTISFAAGTYNFGGTLNARCGQTYTGPTATPATAILNATSSNINLVTVGCNSAITFTYLKFNGAGGIKFTFNPTNVTVTHSQFGGLPAFIGAGSCDSCQAGMYVAGNLNATATNFTVEYNTFGDANSCSAVMDRGTDDGGYCIGFYIYNGFATNIVFKYNTINHIEEGVHINQQAGYTGNPIPEGVCDGCDIEYNTMTNCHRICVEIQVGVINHAFVLAHNYVGPPYHATYGTLNFSLACCQYGRTQTVQTTTQPALYITDNLEISNLGAANNSPYGIEFWGTDSQAHNNVMQGAYCDGYAWGNGAGAWAITYNVLQGGYMSTGTNCNTSGISSGYLVNEQGRPNPPTFTNNLTGVTSTQITSVQPTVSPSPTGTYSAPISVTISVPVNTSAIPSGLNTIAYYTTDGSNPSTSSNICNTPPATSCTISVVPGTTVKTLGMWGFHDPFFAQPSSYPSGYGYAPSGVVSKSYVAGSGVTPTLSSIAVSLPARTLTVGGAGETATASCIYSSGPPYDCSTGTTPYGHGPVTFTTSDPTIATIIAGPGAGAGVIAPVAAGNVNIAAALGVLTATSMPLTVVSGGTPAALILGQNQNDYAGYTNAGYFNSIYYVTTATTVPGNCHMILSGTAGSGKHYDCLLRNATSATTGASTAICKGTYTTSGTTAPGSISWAMTGCPSTIPAGAYFMDTITDDPTSPIAMGFYDCGGTCQTSTAPTSGAGTYAGFYVAVTYGSYSSIPTTFAGRNSVQPTQWIDLTATGTGMALVSAYQDNSGNINSLIKGAGGYQQHVYCVYADNVTFQCDFPTSSATDARGSKVTAWSESSGGLVLSIGAAGTATEGLISATNYGFSNIGCTVTGGIPCSGYTWYVLNNPAQFDSYKGMRLSGMTVR